MLSGGPDVHIRSLDLKGLLYPTYDCLKAVETRVGKL